MIGNRGNKRVLANPALMRRYEVSSRVNLVKNNDAACGGASGAGSGGWCVRIARSTNESRKAR
jgi:hypothetical protein